MMPIATISSKGQLVIPKEIRSALQIKPKQKVLLRVANGRIELEPLPENPVEHYCGIFKEGSSLTEALLKSRKEDEQRETEGSTRLLRRPGVSEAGK